MAISLEKNAYSNGWFVSYLKKYLTEGLSMLQLMGKNEKRKCRLDWKSCVLLFEDPEGRKGKDAPETVGTGISALGR